MIAFLIGILVFLCVIGIVYWGYFFGTKKRNRIESDIDYKIILGLPTCSIIAMTVISYSFFPASNINHAFVKENKLMDSLYSSHLNEIDSFILSFDSKIDDTQISFDSIEMESLLKDINKIEQKIEFWDEESEANEYSLWLKILRTYKTTITQWQVSIYKSEIIKSNSAPTEGTLKLIQDLQNEIDSFKQANKRLQQSSKSKLLLSELNLLRQENRKLSEENIEFKKEVDLNKKKAQVDLYFRIGLDLIEILKSIPDEAVAINSRKLIARKIWKYLCRSNKDGNSQAGVEMRKLQKDSKLSAFVNRLRCEN